VFRIISEGEMKIRRATIQDANLLLKWRNDPQTKKANYTQHEIQRDEHITWLIKILNDTNKKLLIAEENGVRVGAIRVDYSDGIYEVIMDGSARDEMSWNRKGNGSLRGTTKNIPNKGEDLSRQ
jgi:hypothetical protein